MSHRIYKKLQLKDLDLVEAMGQKDGFRQGFIDRESARHFLSNPLNWIFACIEDNRVIGFAYGYELNRLDSKGNMVYIHEVGVLPQYMRQGIGLALLVEMKGLCKLMGISRFFLFTQRNNTAACALYKKAGGETGPDAKDDDVTFFFSNFG